MAVRFAGGGLQSYDPYQKFKSKKTKSEAPKKKTCPEGQRLVNGKCVKIEEPKPEVKPGTFVSGETGKPSGITLPGGDTFLGLNPQDVASIQRAEGLQDMGLVGEARKPELTAEQAEEIGLLPEEKAGVMAPGIEQQQIMGEKGLVEKYLWSGAPDKEDILKGAESFSMMFGASALVGGWKVGGKVIGDPKKVVHAGNAVKNRVAVESVWQKVMAASVTISAGLFGFERLSNLAFNRKIAEQQTSLNTIGTITSTITGESLGGAGDYRKGLAELEYLKQCVLQVEQDMKNGILAEKTLEFRGKTYTIGSDIYDQLSTIHEGVIDIRSFALEGMFPELSPYEIQQMLRKLESEGHIKPVDLTTARREIK